MKHCETGHIIDQLNIRRAGKGEGREMGWQRRARKGEGREGQGNGKAEKHLA